MNWSTQRRLHWETVEVCLRSWSPWGGSWAHSLKEPSSRRRGGTHDLATSQPWVTSSSGSGAWYHLSSCRGTQNSPRQCSPQWQHPGIWWHPTPPSSPPSLHAVEPVTQEILDWAEVPQSPRQWHQQQQGTATLEAQAVTPRVHVRAGEGGPCQLPKVTRASAGKRDQRLKL